MANSDSISQVKRRHSADILKIPGVSGIGVEGDENGNDVLAIYVGANTPEITEQLPTVIEGYPVKVVNTGTFRSLPAQSTLD